MSTIPPAFRRNARAFADRLSGLLTRTVTDHPLVVIPRRNSALISFRDLGDAEISGGLRLFVLQRVRHDPADAFGIDTVEYSYSYGRGPDLRDKGWIVRYDYVPDEAALRPEYEYPVAHVHFNGRSEPYEAVGPAGDKPLPKLHFPTRRIILEDFLEHLVVEFDVATKPGRERTLKMLADSRREFERSRSRSE